METHSSWSGTKPLDLTLGAKKGPKLTQHRSKPTMNKIKAFYLKQAGNEAHNQDPKALP